VRVRASVDGASITVGGKPAGSTPLRSAVFVEPGATVVQAKLAGYLDARQELTVEKGSDREVSLTLVPAPAEHRSIVPGIVVGSVGLVAGAIGVGLAAAGGSKGSDADALLAQMRGGRATAVCPAGPDCAKLKDLLASRDRNLSAGVGLLVGGGVALAAGVTYLLWPSPPRSEQQATSTRLVPVAVPGGGGVWATGSF
jgi:hypothetical protein